MEILNHQNSKKQVEKLCSIFNIEANAVDKYMQSKLISGIFYRSLPLLWYPQKKERKYLYDVFENYVVFGHLNEYKPEMNVFREVIIPKIAEYLKLSKIGNFYAVADWHPIDKKAFHHVMKITPRELIDIINKFYGDGYFFNDNFNWLFGTTHEDFSYLAGTEEFISDFKKFFPEYAQYDLGYDPFGKEREHQ